MGGSNTLTSDLEVEINKLIKYNGKLSGMSAALSKLEIERKNSFIDRDRLAHKVKELELELKNQLNLAEDVVQTNDEYSRKLIRFEELIGQIEGIRKEMAEKAASLEDENEALISEKMSLNIQLTQANNTIKDLEKLNTMFKEQLDLYSNLQKEKQHEEETKTENTEEVSKPQEISSPTSKKFFSDQITLLQNTLNVLRRQHEQVVLENQSTQKVNVELTANLEKGIITISELRNEVQALQNKNKQLLELSKSEVNVANHVASNMYQTYKMRETIRQSQTSSAQNNLPFSFCGEERAGEVNARPINVNSPGRSPFRPSTAEENTKTQALMEQYGVQALMRNSVMSSSFGFIISSAISFRPVYECPQARSIFEKKGLPWLPRKRVSGERPEALWRDFLRWRLHVRFRFRPGQETTKEENVPADHQRFPLRVRPPQLEAQIHELSQVHHDSKYQREELCSHGHSLRRDGHGSRHGVLPKNRSDCVRCTSSEGSRAELIQTEN
jgi:hypothetical protein